MASIGSYLPSPGSAVWRRDVAVHPHLEPNAQEGRRVRHVVIRDAQIWNKPAPYVVYRIDVLTEHDHWYMYKRYSQFYSMHSKLVKKYSTKVQLPPKKLSGNLSKALIDKRRQLLETYLQKLVHGEPQVALSSELMEFLDVPTHDVIEVTDILTRYLYIHGDQLLEEATPISLSVNEMYAITKRLLFPRDAAGEESTDVAGDPAHLYSFVQQLESLKISLPPAPTSVCCSHFEMAHFKSLHNLKMDKVPLGQVGGLVSIQQQLKKLAAHRTLHTLRELLIEAVEEKRGSLQGAQSSPVTPVSKESWRISATARLTSSRVIVQPWHSLHTLTLSHNLLTHLDDSLQLLPVLRELSLSHNQLQELHLRFLCLPSLEKLSVAHNSISIIHTDKKVLERITYLNLSHNRLQSLGWVNAFVGVGVLNLSYNLLSQRLDLDKLTLLKMLNTLTITGNPIASSNVCRMFVLAKFMQKSRKVILDGQEATSKEQAKLQSLIKKHGEEPDLWPLAKSLTYIESSGDHHSTPPPSPSTHTPSDLEVSWQVQSSLEHKPRPLTQSKLRSLSLPLTGVLTPEKPPTHGSFDSIPSPQHEQYGERPLFPQTLASPGRLDYREWRNSEEKYSVGGAASPLSLTQGSVASLSSREDPDGQSDISSMSPEPCLNEASERSSVTVLTPPPSTPLPQQEDASKPTITPAMIRSALESLQQLQSSQATPPQSGSSPSSTHNQICPETVASALSVIMSQETNSSEAPTPRLSPPPSTPLGESADQPTTLSSTDLISALSVLVNRSRHSSVGGASGDSSVVCSVPACSPSEERHEFLRLGFKPEDVIQALSALSLQAVEGDSIEEPTSSLSPIEEERGSLTVDHSDALSLSARVQARDSRSASRDSSTLDHPEAVSLSVTELQTRGRRSASYGSSTINHPEAFSLSTELKTRDRRSASQGSMTVDKLESPGPIDFVFSPPDPVLGSECTEDDSSQHTTTEGNLVASCSPTDDVLYS